MEKEQNWNLSDKWGYAFRISDKEEVIRLKDVREFIKRLKIFILNYFEDPHSPRGELTASQKDYLVEIDKLAGDKLC